MLELAIMKELTRRQQINKISFNRREMFNILQAVRSTCKKPSKKKGLQKWIAIFLSSWLVALTLGSPSTAVLIAANASAHFQNSTAASATSLPTLARLAASPADSVAANRSGNIAASEPANSAPANITTDDISAGILAFEQGQIRNAIAQWQSALSQLPSTAPNHHLTRAYLLSNLATAYQQLGQIEQSQQALGTSLNIINRWPDNERTPAYWEISARVLNTQGQSQWQQGLTQEALTTRQQAEQHYRQATQREESSPISIQVGLILSQINQALALQELGFNAQAVQQLNALIEQIPALSLSVQLSATKELGKALRRIGELSSAQSILSAALAVKNSRTADASDSTLAEQRQALQLELGHTARALSHRAIAIGQIRPAQDYTDQALSYYTTAGQRAPSNNPLLQVQAQLNQLSYLIETGQLAAATAFWPSIQLTALPLSRASTEAHISYAHSLNCLRAPATTACTKTEWQEAQQEISSSAPTASALPFTPQQQEKMLGALTTAIAQAKALNDSLLEIYAIGELGHTYELTNQSNEAIRLTRQALALLEGKQMPEIAYRWQWQLARLYRDSTDTTNQARIAYEQALSSLAAVRQNLLLVDPQVQFSFRDNVEPVYREFVELLVGNTISSDTTINAQSVKLKTVNLKTDTSTTEPSQQDLELAVQTLDALQLTELENFLGCNLSQLVTLSAPQSDPKAIKLYPIILSNQLTTIVDVPGQPLTLRTVAIDKATVESTLKSLRDNLVLPGKTPNVLNAAQQLYSWLIEPVTPILAANPQIETLVFVPDGPLRNIPMGVLYDGEQYLIEKDYAIAIAPQLDLFAPRSAPQQLKVLRGGIGLPQTVRGQSFPPIELIQAELNQIPDELTVAQPLINENFTQPNIEAQLAKETYSAIHWKTHGVFSSSPGETFLVAYQDGITANELSTLVRSASQQQAEPLELLVLSACATAQGDRRAVLGLAGIAVRAGTRSTLSTLWRADDGANTELMASFYEGLGNGLTKAQSLQKAQKMLLSEVGYPAPYYWASYVLVGNWL